MFEILVSGQLEKGVRQKNRRLPIARAPKRQLQEHDWNKSLTVILHLT